MVPLSQENNMDDNNQTISEANRFAPSGKYRLIFVDLFDGTDWIVGDYDSLDESTRVSRKKMSDSKLIASYIYNEAGACVYSTRE